MLLEKRGQFFLIAALIIIAIIFSFGIIYNSAQVSSTNSVQVQSLAEEIQYESMQLVNSGVNKNIPANVTALNILSLASSYSKLYPNYNITIGYLDSYSSIYGAAQFRNGISSSVPVSVSENITLTLNNIPYSFTIIKGYNVHIIVWAEGENERHIGKA